MNSIPKNVKNEIVIKSNDKEKINIHIEGNNNQIIIEDIIVRGYLNIFIVGNNSLVYIKKNCSFEGCTINLCEDNNHVIIGEDCMFALDTIILASDFHSITDLRSKKRINKRNGVDLDSHIWVGYRALILKGTQISHDSVVAAGAVVNGKFSSNVIIGGVPSKIIKRKITWLRETI